MRKGPKKDGLYLAGIETGHDVSCPGCGASFIPLPLEPLFTLKAACLLVPCEMHQLKRVLTKAKEQVRLGPVLYRYEGRVRRRVRLLSAKDLKKLRAYFIKPKVEKT